MESADTFECLLFEFWEMSIDGINVLKLGFKQQACTNDPNTRLVGARNLFVINYFCRALS